MFIASKRLILTLSTSLVAAFAAQAASAEMSASLKGRIDFMLEDSDYVSINPACTGPASLASPTLYTSQVQCDADTALDTEARLDLKIRGEQNRRNLSGLIRLDMDPDANVITDIEAYIKSSGRFGTVAIGTDIDGYQDVFETDLLSAGPLSPGKQAQSVVVGHQFSQTNPGTTSVVLTSRPLNGVKGQIEVDGHADWAASIHYSGGTPAMEIEAGVAADADEAVGGNIKLTFGDLSVGAFGGVDGDEETFVGGGVRYGIGAFILSLEGSHANGSVTESNIKYDIDETDVVAGAGMDVSRNLNVSGSVGYFMNSATSTLGNREIDGLQAKGRLRLKF